MTTSYLLHAVVQFIRFRWWIVAILSSLLCLPAACIRIFESKKSRERRLQQKKIKELRSLATQISAYGLQMQKRFPDGAVIVSENDLAEQLRKPTEPVVHALNVLLKDHRVQRTPLSGYWRLNA